MFESASAVGGTYSYSAGQVWVAGSTQDAVGIVDGVEDGIEHVRGQSPSRHDGAILSTYRRELPVAAGPPRSERAALDPEFQHPASGASLK